MNFTRLFKHHHVMIHTPLKKPNSNRAILSIFALSSSLGLINYSYYQTKQQNSLCENKKESVVVQKSREEVLDLLSGMQNYFVNNLEKLNDIGEQASFKEVEWKRGGGKYGGGSRFETTVENGGKIFDRASVNISSVHYETIEKSRIDSATALSVILHPQNPYAPSMHFHISYMIPRIGQPYWRMIADLNPSIENKDHKSKFEKVIKNTMSEPLYRDAEIFGDKYFYIPVLERTRGISHMFIAKLEPGIEAEPENCLNLAEDLAKNAIGIYCNLVQDAIDNHPKNSITEKDLKEQLDYHTLYFFQVLTLDRGTTHGLLSHNENDVGTLGSLPSKVDGALLKSWKEKVKAPHDILIDRLIEVLPMKDKGVSEVTSNVRGELAEVLRQFYQQDRERIKYQADMDLEWWAEVTPKRINEKKLRNLSTNEILAELAARFK